MLLQLQIAASFLAQTSLTVVMHCVRFYILHGEKVLTNYLLLYWIVCAVSPGGNRSAAMIMFHCHVAVFVRGISSGVLGRRSAGGACVFRFRPLGEGQETLWFWLNVEVNAPVLVLIDRSRY